MDSSRVGLLSSSLVSIFCFKCTNTGLKMTLALLLKMEKVIILMEKRMIIMRAANSSDSHSWSASSSAANLTTRSMNIYKRDFQFHVS